MSQAFIKERPKLTRTETAAAPRRICFVCTGNTCRSPMAEAVVNSLAERVRASYPEAVRSCVVPPLVAYSAGLYPMVGEPIAANAVRALEEAGVFPISQRDYHLHTAKPLSEEEAAGFDLLIGMSASHVMELILRFPALSQRIVAMPRSISDPYGGDLACYKACLEEITKGVEQLLLAGELE